MVERAEENRTVGPEPPRVPGLGGPFGTVGGKRRAGEREPRRRHPVHERGEGGGVGEGEIVKPPFCVGQSAGRFAGAVRGIRGAFRRPEVFRGFRDGVRPHELRQHDGGKPRADLRLAGHGIRPVRDGLRQAARPPGNPAARAVVQQPFHFQVLPGLVNSPVSLPNIGKNAVSRLPSLGKIDEKLPRIGNFKKRPRPRPPPGEANKNATRIK